MPDPVAFVPPRYRPTPADPTPPPEMSEEQLEAESKQAWAMMHQYFRGGHVHGR